MELALRPQVMLTEVIEDEDHDFYVIKDVHTSLYCQLQNKQSSAQSASKCQKCLIYFGTNVVYTYSMYAGDCQVSCFFSENILFISLSCKTNIRPSFGMYNDEGC